MSQAVPVKVQILETGTSTNPPAKPCSKASSKSSSKPGGFTLVELLVVIVLIAILGSLVVLSVDVDQESRELEASAQQIRQYLQNAFQEAILSGYPVGLLVEDNSLVFLLVGEQGWEMQLENETLPIVTVNPRWQMSLQAELGDSDSDLNTPGGKIVPQVLIYAEGYADPFSILLTAATESISYSISTDGSRLFSVEMLDR